MTKASTVTAKQDESTSVEFSKSSLNMPNVNMDTSGVMDLNHPVTTTIKGKNEHWKESVAMHINDVTDKCDACIGTDKIEVLLNKRDACVATDFVSSINIVKRILQIMT